MRRHSTRLQRSARVGAIVVAVIAVGACRQAIATYPSTDPRPAVTTLLTPDGTDAYNYASSTGQMQVAALDTNTSANLRSAFWPADSPVVADAQSCATWASESIASAQQGAALRIATANGSTRAITVTKNIVFGATWIFNVHTWDTAATPAFQPAGSISLKPELWPNDVESPLPWHVCVRTVGTTLDLNAWRADEPEPAWGETSHGGSVTLPESAVYPGATGWYMGHLRAGAHAEFSDLRTWKLVVGPAAASQPTPALVATSTATPGAVTVTGGLPPR